MRYKVNTKLAKGRVRKSPTTKSKTVKLLKKGTIVTVDKIVDGWCHLPAYGGYIKSSIMQKIEDSPKPAPEPPKPQPVPSGSNAQKIAEIATRLAYPTNTKSAAYPSGKPTAEYKEAFAKAFPTANKYSKKAHRVGANCGGFVGTVVRTAGIDKDFPHTSVASYKYLENKTKWERIEAKQSALQDGDIIIYQKGNDGHICIYVDGKIKEASYAKFYPKTTASVASRLSSAGGKKNVRVYRARG